MTSKILALGPFSLHDAERSAEGKAAKEGSNDQKQMQVTRRKK
jgi:hypothetical protein